jgi:2-methylcitrate dehydratase PrpD
MTTTALATFASTLAFDDIPPEIVTVAKQLVLDTLGCAIAATTLGDACPEVIDVMCGLGGRNESTILGTCARVTAQNAAFANGALAHALNYDAYAERVGHLGVVALVAPLAAAEARGHISGREFLTGVVAACEVTARVHVALSRLDTGAGGVFLAGQLLSYFGAAVGAGRVFGLDDVAMRSALGLSLMQAAGSRQVVLEGDPPAKAIYGGFPNQAGVQAAVLAKGGVRADCDVFGPPAGLYSMVYGGAYDPGALTSRLGDAYRMEEIQFKPWPTSAKLHPFIEACLDLASRGISTEEVASVTVFGRVSYRPWCEPVEKRRAPTNAAAAANSVQFVIGKTLVHGTVGPHDFTTDGLRDAKALAIAAQTVCRLEGEDDGVAVEVELKSGKRLHSRIDRSRPMSTDMLIRKFEECCRYSARPLQTSAVARLIETILDLDRLDDVAQIASIATAATGPKRAS